MLSVCVYSFFEKVDNNYEYAHKLDANEEQSDVAKCL
jgi:hypothetical protein